MDKLKPSNWFKFNEKTKSIYLNFIGFNVSFSLVFTAVNCVASIQSVLISDKSLGTTTQLTIFCVQLLTSFVIPQVVVETFGYKWSCVLAELLFLVYIAFQAFPRWYTLIPCAVLAGVGQSLAWNIMGMFLTHLSKKYSIVTSKIFPDVQLTVYGLSSAMFLLSYVIGAVLVATILRTETITSAATFDYSTKCGAWNCPNTILPETSSVPTLESVYVLCGCLVAAVLAAIVTTLFLVDNVKDEEPECKEVAPARLSLKSRFRNELKSIVDTHRNLDTWLLYPLSIYTGFELTFIWYEFGRAFAACLKDINYIGWSMILFGSAGALLSIIMIWILKHAGKSIGIVFMLNIALTECIYILSWTPNQNQFYLMFIMIVGFALTESIATGQVRGIYGVIFPNNPSAFSAATIGQTFGFVIGCLVTLFACVYVKTFVYMCIIIASLCGFVAIEIRNKRKIQRDETDQDRDMLIKLDSLDFINNVRF